MYCSLCKKWKRHLPGHSNVWTTTPCVVLRRDSILDHVRSKSHCAAATAEQEAVQTRLTGGIAQAFEQVRTMKKNALVGAFKCMYWLAKREMAYTTNFESLIQLAISLGSTYMKELNQGENVKYTSQESKFEFIKVLALCVEQQILSEVNQVEYVSILCDETTDISVTKQLIVYLRYVIGGDLQVRYFKICEVADGTADTIRNALLSIT